MDAGRLSRHCHRRPCLIVDNTLDKKPLIDRKPARRTGITNGDHGGRAIREVSLREPIADAGVADAKQRANFVPAEGVDHRRNRGKSDHGKAFYSSRLKFVKQHEPELPFGREDETIPAMAKAQRKPIKQPHQRSIDAIADRLLRTRLALGLNQTALCARADLAKNTYNQWECGRGRPGLDYAIRLCDAFGLTLDWIYFGDESCLRGYFIDKLRSGH